MTVTTPGGQACQSWGRVKTLDARLADEPLQNASQHNSEKWRDDVGDNFIHGNASTRWGLETSGMPYITANIDPGYVPHLANAYTLSIRQVWT